MERLINTALMIIGILVWAVRKYGMVAMFTRKYAKHAAVGRAARRWFSPVRDHRLCQYDAATLLENLRRERMEQNYALVS